MLRGSVSPHRRAPRSGNALSPLNELIATPEGTELTYHVTGLTGDEGYTPRQDVVAIRSGGAAHVLARGAFSLHSDHAFSPHFDPAGLRRQLSSTSAIPQPS